jgi:hypothetical protein
MSNGVILSADRVTWQRFVPIADIMAAVNG